MGIFGVVGSSTAAALAAWIYRHLKRRGVPDDVDDEEVQQLVENEEITEEMLEDVVGENVPEPVQAFVGQRLGDLDEEAVEMLEMAAEEGEQAAEIADVVARLAGLANDPAAFTQALNELDGDILGEVIEGLAENGEINSAEFGEALRGFLQANGAVTEENVAVGEGVVAGEDFGEMAERGHGAGGGRGRLQRRRVVGGVPRRSRGRRGGGGRLPRGSAGDPPRPHPCLRVRTERRPSAVGVSPPGALRSRRRPPAHGGRASSADRPARRRRGTRSSAPRPHHRAARRGRRRSA